jgi:uncharacterized protein (TIGR02271 family)
VKKIHGSRSTTVVDEDGRRGTIEDRIPNSAEDTEQVLVRIDDRLVAVPAERLVEQEDGSFFLSLSLAQLHHQEHAVEKELVIPVVEERARVEKRQRETGRVRVTRHTETHTEIINEPRVQEQAEIQRVPINQVVEGPLPVRQEGNTTIIPVVEEVLVVEKRLVLREEVHVTKHRVETQDPLEVSLRRQEVTVTRTEEEDPEGR